MKVKNYVVSLILMAAMACSFSLVSFADSFSKKEAAVVTGHTVSLGANVDLNYFMKIPSNVNAKNLRARFTYGSTTVEAPLVKVNVNGSNYVAQCNLQAVNMTDSVKMTVLDKSNKVVLSDSYRVVDYVDSLALKYRDTVNNRDKYLQRLLEAVLIYGSNAQQHYGYRTSDLADSACYMKNIMTSSGNHKYKVTVDQFREDAQGIINDIYCKLLGSNLIDIEDDNAGLKFKDVAIDFSKSNEATFYFDITDASRAYALKVSYKGSDVPLVKENGSCHFVIKGIEPEYFGYEFMEIKVGNKTYKYMPLDYIAHSFVDGNMKDLACAAYAYGYFLNLYIDNIETEMPNNGIPVVYLNIDEARGTIDDMIDSPDHSIYCYGKMSIDVPEGFRYSDFPDNICKSFKDLSMSIRGRGNTTWSEDKKPFKIKLDNKADLFGLGANKHWVLIANRMDSTLLKDRITAWLGDKMGFDFTPRGVPVDVVISGGEFGTQYIGSYYLSENVRVDSNRLDIDELSKNDYDPQTITGGYLLQNGAQVRADSPDRFFTSRGANWATHTPSFDTSGNDKFALKNIKQEDTFSDPELGDGYVNKAQQQYIQNHMQHVEDVMYQGGTAYRELMDVESAAKYWMVQCFCLNSDAYATGSTYLYKERDVGGKVGKIYWGPLWDFDYAWTYNRIYTGFIVDSTWLMPLMCDRTEGGFIPEVMKQWKKLKPALEELIKDGGVIDKYYAETKASAEADFRVNDAKGSKQFDYLKEVNDLKQWIRNRIDWVDANISTLGDYVHRVEFVVDGKTYAAEYLNKNDRIGPDYVKHPVREGCTFVGWQDKDGNLLKEDTYITEDSVFTAVFMADEDVTHGEDIVFESDHVTIKLNVHVSYYQIAFKVVPEDAIDKEVVWTSSDESYATVDENGLIHYNGIGEVTITGTLKNGVSRQFVLTVEKGEYDAMEVNEDVGDIDTVGIDS